MFKGVITLHKCYLILSNIIESGYLNINKVGGINPRYSYLTHYIYKKCVQDEDYKDCRFLEPRGSPTTPPPNSDKRRKTESSCKQKRSRKKRKST
jgi:hypothetical protein